MVTIKTNMGMSKVIYDGDEDSLKTWTRVKTKNGDIKATVIISNGIFVSVQFSDLTLAVIMQHNLEVLHDDPEPIPIKLLIRTNYDFGMSTYNLYLKDGSLINCCYRKGEVFLEVPSPHRRIGLWEINKVIPEI